MRKHVDNYEHKSSRRQDNNAAFKVLVREFLTEHGGNYWGNSHEPISRSTMYRRVCGTLEMPREKNLGKPGIIFQVSKSNTDID